MANEDYPQPYFLYGYPPDYEPDIYDDDYWRWHRLRKPVLHGVLHIEQRSKELQAEAEAERLKAERMERETASSDDPAAGES